LRSLIIYAKSVLFLMLRTG